MTDKQTLKSIEDYIGKRSKLNIKGTIIFRFKNGLEHVISSANITKQNVYLFGTTVLFCAIVKPIVSNQTCKACFLVFLWYFVRFFGEKN